MENNDLAVATASALERRFEGCRLRPYLDAVCVATIGYGATFYEDGTRVTLSDPEITRERAEALLQWHVRHVYLPAVLRLCPGADNPNRLAALIDFAFNLGTGRLKNSNLRRRVNARDWQGAVREFGKWNKAGGRVLPGLTARRNAEAALCVT